MTTPSNWSFHAIAGAYALSYPPAIYQYVKGMTASGWQGTNVAPRTNLEILKPKLDSKTYSKIARARGAHLNALEGFPLFAAAMIAGNYANLEVKELNFCAAEYMFARVLYTALYMTTTKESLSYVRSGVYFWSVGIPFYVLWKAGNKLAEQM